MKIIYIKIKNYKSIRELEINDIEKREEGCLWKKSKWDQSRSAAW